MLRFLYCASAFVALIACYSPVNANTRALPLPEHLPGPTLASMLREGIFIEQYVQQVLEPMRRLGIGTSYTKRDIDAHISKTVQQAERQQLSRMVNYDLDKDGQLTRAEIEKALNDNGRYGSNPQRIEQEVATVLKLDTNADMIVSYKEMSTLDEKQKAQLMNNSSAQLTRYLELDPNKDGTLTTIELEKLARDAFNAIDKNMDGRISAEEVPPRQNAADQRMPVTCSISNLKLPQDTVVYATGAYSGRSINYQIDQSGHQATQVDIVVTETEKPVALIVGAYEPTIWNISHLPKTKIVAIVAGGYHRQVIAGVSKEVPTLIGSHGQGGGCGYFYFAPNKLDKLNPIARQVFGKPATMFYPLGKDGKVVIGPTDYDAERVISEKFSPDAYREKDSPLAGSAGLEDAVKNGILRPATEKDKEEWLSLVTSLRKDEPVMDLPPIAGGSKPIPNVPRIQMFRTYVVLKPFVYPAGLYGGNSANFIIAKGVQAPTGEKGHSSVYDMNSGQCSGPSCRTE